MMSDSGGVGGAGGGRGGSGGGMGGGDGVGGKSGTGDGAGNTGGVSGKSGTGETSGVGNTGNANGVGTSDMGEVSAAADSVSESQVSAQADAVTGDDAVTDGFDKAAPAGGPGVGPSEGAMAEADRRSAEAARQKDTDHAAAAAAATEADAAKADAAEDAEARTVSEGTQAEIDRRAENARVEALADRLAGLSPTAAGLLSSFRAAGGVFERSPLGGWFDENRERPTIGVPTGTDEQNMRTIAHELGHFDFVGNPQGAYAAPGRPTGVTDRQIEHTRQADYIRDNTNARLADEGNAALMNRTIRDEVFAATGIDLGVSGDLVGNPMPFGVGTVEAQRAALGDYFGTNLTTSTTGENYRSYYGGSYRDHYDANHLPGRER